MKRAIQPSWIDDQSATLAEIAPHYGATRTYRGNKYRCFKAGATIPARTVCMFSALDGTTGTAVTTPIDGTVGETVVVTTGATVNARCANASLASITSGNYFWGLEEGYCCLTGGGSVTAGSTIMPNASGAVQNFAEAGAVALGNHPCGVALEDDIATTYYVTCFFKAGFAHDVNA